MKRGLLVLTVLSVLAAASRAPGQVISSLASDSPSPKRDEDDKTVRLVLHPAAEPRPALKYQLLPEFLDMRPGNAAVHYGKVTAEQIAFFSDRELQDKIAEFADAPLEELRGDDVPGVLRSSNWPVFRFLYLGARCETCDWQLPFREEEFYTMLLPHIQQARSYARILAARARVLIAEGKYDEAVETFQTGYALGRHTSQDETLVSGLVGIAICHMMSKQVQTMIQQPDAPNLYWALTKLPRPLVSVEAGIEAEMNAVRLSFPQLRDLEDTSRSPDYWRASLERFWSKFATYADDDFDGRLEGLTLLAVRGYPMAKQGLIERGRSPEQVEAMPVPQVVLLYTMQTYEDLRDDMFKWFYVPYSEAKEGFEQAEAGLRRCMAERREVIPLASLLLPAIQSCYTAVVRTDREIAALRVIEAIRLFGAANDGRLPKELNDLTVPVPDDPITGKPFDYRLDGDTAVLEGPTLRGAPLRFEIQFAR
ncbi:MAG: hypothetical protein ACYTG0_02075 [Planctomycetota bacterium]|jgi:hypothetical protein